MSEPIYLAYYDLIDLTPPSPAKLSTLGDLTVTLNNTNASGTVYFYLQHYNDRLGGWCDLEGKLGLWTCIGSLTASGTVSMPDFDIGVGEKIHIGMGFQSSDGTLPAPKFVSLSVSWGSDVTAPDLPTIMKLVSVSPEGGKVGYRLDMGDLPENAHHFIVEVKMNDGEYTPFSKRAKVESDYGYLEFLGNIDQIEAAGSRNESHFSFAKGLQIGDKIKCKVACVDNVGNVSSFTESDTLTLESIKILYVQTPVQSINMKIDDSDTVEFKVVNS